MSFILGALIIGLMIFMCWRILEKAGFPGWWSLVHLLTLTGILGIASLIFFWVLAFMRWPRDDAGFAMAGSAPPGMQPRVPPVLPAPPASVPGPPAGQSESAPSVSSTSLQAESVAPAASPTPAAPVSWALEGKLSDGTPGRLVVDDSRPVYVIGATDGPDVLLVPDPSVGSPHARILTAPGRIGLLDLGSASGTWIDGVRLLPTHGARDITNSRQIRFGAVDLALTRL